MFKKKTCKRCGEKIKDKFNFCPYCGNNNGNSEEDWGLLGKNDLFPEEEMMAPILGGFSGKIFNKMLGSAMKMLEKEMQKEMKENRTMEMPLKTNFELFVNGKRIAPENIKVMGKPVQKTPVKKTSYSKHFDSKNLKKFSELPKKEPLTNVRRLSDKVVYEIDVPGVKSIEDISIVKLENSIEIKALAKNAAYNKIIAVDLPLKRYKLEEEKLVLELGVKG